MTSELEKLVVALERGQATPEQQKEATRKIRDLDRELRELEEWQTND